MEFQTLLTAASTPTAETRYHPNKKCIKQNGAYNFTSFPVVQNICKLQFFSAHHQYSQLATFPFSCSAKNHNKTRLRMNQRVFLSLLLLTIYFDVLNGAVPCLSTAIMEQL